MSVEPTPPQIDAIAHCVDKVRALVAAGADDRRAWLQIGYNLGRLSELTGAGRVSFWDRWKGPVADGDFAALRLLVDELGHAIGEMTRSGIDGARSA